MRTVEITLEAFLQLSCIHSPSLLLEATVCYFAVNMLITLIYAFTLMFSNIIDSIVVIHSKHC